MKGTVLFLDQSDWIQVVKSKETMLESGKDAIQKLCYHERMNT